MTDLRPETQSSVGAPLQILVEQRDKHDPPYKIYLRASLPI